MEDSKENSNDHSEALHPIGKHRVSFFSGHEPEEAYVFFHGFPGIRSRQNRDLAEHLSKTTGLDSYVMHYAGLKVHKGQFSFLQSIEDACDLSRLLLNRYGRLHLVGHSFGGLIACEVLNQFHEAIRSITLLSPLVDFEVISDSRKRLSQEVRQSYPDLFSDADEVRLLDEWKVLYEKYRPIIKAPRLTPVACLILQAREDQYTPTPHALQLVQVWPGPVQYVEVDDDHSFLTNRDAFKVLFNSEISSLLERCS